MWVSDENVCTTVAQFLAMLSPPFATATPALRAELIRKWSPWNKSTEPSTSRGKAKVSKNAFKGGWREQLRELRRALREHEQALTGN